MWMPESGSGGQSLSLRARSAPLPARIPAQFCTGRKLLHAAIILPARTVKSSRAAATPRLDWNPESASLIRTDSGRPGAVSTNGCLERCQSAGSRRIQSSRIDPHQVEKPDSGGFVQGTGKAVRIGCGPAHCKRQYRLPRATGIRREGGRTSRESGDLSAVNGRGSG